MEMLMSSELLRQIPTHLLPSEFEKGIVIVYDGECPFCSRFVEYSKLKSQFGTVFLLNAREHNQLTTALKEVGIDIDREMVVIRYPDLYAGHEAVRFLAEHSVYPHKGSSLLLRGLRFGAVARILYPALRAGRLLALRILGIGSIHSDKQRLRTK